jgi:hypothetical protein
MTTMTIIQKWKNLSLLIVSKTEHKEKFYNRIDCGDNGIVVRNYGLESIPYLIGNILRDKIRFNVDLRGLILDKIKEYTDHRKTMTLVDYDDTTEYNPENDCPICFEPMTDNDLGYYCEHYICGSCSDKIRDTNNKCPLCREVWYVDDGWRNELNDGRGGFIELVNEDDLEDDTDEDDTDDDEDDLFNGNNERPTTNLFTGQRWFNIDTNEMEYYAGGRWNNNQGYRLDVYDFMTRYYQTMRGEQDEVQCQVCGIQRTREVNTFIMDRHTNLLIDDERWDNAFNYQFDECFECRLLMSQMSETYYNNR